MHTPRESYESPEFLSPEQSMNLLAGMGHEAQLLTAGIILTNPNEGFTSSRIHTDLSSGLGAVKDWRPLASTIERYCDSGFEPVAQVVTHEVKYMREERANRAVYKTTELGADAGLAWIGVGLGWSLPRPHRSLLPIFWGRGSETNIKAPEARLRIYQRLLATDDLCLPTAQLTEPVTGDDLMPDVYQSELAALKSIGLLETVQLPRTAPVRGGGIVLNHRWAEDIKDLCDRIQDFREGKNITQFKEQALAIINDRGDYPRAGSELLGKLRNFSSGRIDIDTPRPWVSELPDIVYSLFPNATLETVQNSLSDRGINYSDDHVRTKLRMLTTLGILGVFASQSQADPHHYYLNSESFKF